MKRSEKNIRLFPPAYSVETEVNTMLDNRQTDAAQFLIYI